MGRYRPKPTRRQASLSDKWYNLQAWRVRRTQQLSREPFCRLCRERDLLVPASVADHVEPHREDYDRFFFGALQSLCYTCHSSFKQRYEKVGVVVGTDTSGGPLDAGSHWHTGRRRDENPGG